MSECGNAPKVMFRDPMVKKIAIERVTRGTETSKYPEEEKETSIPQVAASEQGRAQTRCLHLGLRTLVIAKAHSGIYMER